MKEKLKTLLSELSKNKIYSTIAFALSVVLLFTCCTVSFAWLFDLMDIKPDLSFSAGAPDDYVLFKVTCANDTNVHTVEETTKLGTDGFSVSDLQFGKIANLGMLENSNYIYYAIRVPKENGFSASIGVSYGDTDGDGKHFKVYLPTKDNTGAVQYDTNNNVITYLLDDDAILSNLEALETDANSNVDKTFVNCRIALSEKAPSEFASIDELNAIFPTTHKSLVTDTNGNPVVETIEIEEASVTSDYYYAYIKLEPNVSIYSGFIDYLWNDMPFFLAYEIRVTFEVAE